MAGALAKAVTFLQDCKNVRVPFTTPTAAAPHGSVRSVCAMHVSSLSREIRNRARADDYYDAAVRRNGY